MAPALDELLEAIEEAGVIEELLEAIEEAGVIEELLEDEEPFSHVSVDTLSPKITGILSIMMVQ